MFLMILKWLNLVNLLVSWVLLAQTCSFLRRNIYTVCSFIAFIWLIDWLIDWMSWKSGCSINQSINRLTDMLSNFYRHLLVCPVYLIFFLHSLFKFWFFHHLTLFTVENSVFQTHLLNHHYSVGLIVWLFDWLIDLWVILIENQSFDCGLISFVKTCVHVKNCVFLY